MSYKAVFKRYEKKYLLTFAQKDALMKIMAEHMKPDEFGCSSIRNIYFDTDDYLLIRRSIDKPAYKEKLRIRSYGKADPDSPTFVEIKKKYDKIVYKRRISLPEQDAMRWIGGEAACKKKGQIPKEIDYFLKHYPGLKPAVFLSYEREAYCSDEQKDLRVTFDRSILARTDRISLQEEVGGTSLLPEGTVLMELKCAGGYPMWLVKFLSENKIYKTSFSKYGTAYKTMIWPKFHRKPLAEEAKVYRPSFPDLSADVPAFGRTAALRHA